MASTLVRTKVEVNDQMLMAMALDIAADEYKRMAGETPELRATFYDYMNRCRQMASDVRDCGEVHFVYGE